MRKWIDIVAEHTELLEATIPPTPYGYWITDLGEFVPVPHEAHDAIARIHSGKDTGEVLDEGWIRVIVEGAVSVSAYFHTHRLGTRAISALRRLTLTEDFQSFVLDVRGSEWISERFYTLRGFMAAVSSWGKKALRESHHSSQVGEVIERQVALTGMEPREINDGWCYFFADKLVDALGGQTHETFAVDTTNEIELEAVGQTYDPTAPRHCFVVHKDRVYDSETPEGRERWQDLPYFQRHSW